MKKEIKLPQVELNMESVTVVRWLVKPGDVVKAEQPILEVETQKAIVEVPSSDAGHVRRLCVKEGETIGEKALLCILTDGPDESFDAPSAVASGVDRGPSEQPRSTTAATADEDGAVRAAPAARKLAKELGVDLAKVKGSGPEGRITVEDVQGARMKDEGGGMKGEGWALLSAARIALNAQMQKSLAEIPQIHVVRQLDVVAISVKAAGVTFTHRLVRTAAAALARHPTLRTIIEGERVKVEPVSVAVAMDTPRGLVAPALRGTEKLPLQEIATRLKDFRARAEAGTLKREELVNAPFAITNLGMFGVDFFSAFVFHGQTAVLAVGRATGGKAWFSLAVDHRVVDGAEASRFLETLQSEISKP